jgi:glycosyltransferase involved in cell wall biosynthesis
VDRPAVSVLVPAFRARPFIERCLGSLLAQSFTDWEAVVLDNASEDGTFEVASGFAARDPRFRASRNPANVGPLRNWRACLERARGRLVALLFVDDWYEPGFLEALVPRLEDPAVGLAFSGVNIVRQAGARIVRSRGHYVFAGRRELASVEYLAGAYDGSPEMPVSPACAVLRAEDARRWLMHDLRDGAALGVADHGAGADLWLFLQACREYPRLAHVDRPLVSFSSHGSNLTYRSEVPRAYAAARLEFAESSDRWAPSQKGLARMAWALRGTDRAAAVRGRLTAAGRLHLLATHVRGAVAPAFRRVFPR